MHWTDRLVKMGACSDAVAWGRKYPTAQKAWTACKRYDWMMWLLDRANVTGERTGGPGHRKMVRLACLFARSTLKHVSKGERRPLLAIQAAERWARKPSDAARAASAAASAAAWAAASTAAWAASTAAWAASTAAWAASDAARAAANCKLIRRLYPRCPLR